MDNGLISRYNLLKGGEGMMGIPENIYESPINIIRETDREIETKIKDGVITIARKYGIDIDEKALIEALRADRTRYEEAYLKGYSKGYIDAKTNQEDIDDIFE